MTGVVDRMKAALADRYAIEREIGRGGMAAVYLAEDLKHHHKVTLEVPLPQLAAVTGVERWFAEIQTTANLQNGGSRQPRGKAIRSDAEHLRIVERHRNGCYRHRPPRAVRKLSKLQGTWVWASLLFVAVACSSDGNTLSTESFNRADWNHPPEPARQDDSVFVDEYDSRDGVVFVIEDQGRLWLIDTARVDTTQLPLARPGDPNAVGEAIVVSSDSAGQPSLVVAGMTLRPRHVGPQGGANQLRISPTRPMVEIRSEARAAVPPTEPGTAGTFDLVDLATLDRAIKFDVRYATTNNFLGTRFYDQARAFLQRPAAEALVRAHQSVAALGYGLLVYDGYRPWYVTKMFWEATPEDKRWLVANPRDGSRHNRGAAVDVTLYSLATGKPVSMPSTYDESTGRAAAGYPGGTALQRWNRALLRAAMESQGFAVHPAEWWHFDYSNWRDYPIGNVSFAEIASRQ